MKTMQLRPIRVASRGTDRVIVRLGCLIVARSLIVVALFTGSSSGFVSGNSGHRGITSAALRCITIFSSGDTLRFSDEMIEEIVRANERTDSILRQAMPWLHFDNDAFEKGSQRLLDLRLRIGLAIQDSAYQPELVPALLGTALHTIQDYYSHSNWVELGNRTIDSRLGRSVFQGLPSGEEPCPDDPSELGGIGLVALTSGWFDLVHPCDAPRGKCVHGGIPWLCAHLGISKDHPGRPGYDEAYALAIKASVDFVHQILEMNEVRSNPKSLRTLVGLARAGP